MRLAFVRALNEISARDRSVMLLSGDLGYKVLEEFIERNPERFINMGVAEQNMVSFAAGLALAGKIPVVYSIATFATLRAYEQIRNDLCYQKLNVKIVGVGSGLTYSQYGATHHSMEDIGLMRLLPDMTVVCPGDPLEAEQATHAIFTIDGPCYLRIASRGEPILHRNDFSLEIGKGAIMKQGGDIALISTGNMLETAVKATDILESSGIRPTLVSMHTVKPLDRPLITRLRATHPRLVTLEEHSIIGGLGSAVAEVLAESGYDGRFMRIGGPDAFQATAGWLEYIRGRNGLLPDQVAERIKRFLQ